MNYYNPPTPSQQALDKAMARANSRKCSKSFIQWLCGLFTAANREWRANRRKK